MRSSLMLITILGLSFSAKAAEAKKIQISGPAAEEIAVLLKGKRSQNVSCEKTLASSCPTCDGGTEVTVCTLEVDSAPL